MQALKQAEANGDSKRANDIRTYLDYKKSLDAPPPSSKGDSADGYRASVEAARPLDDPAFVAWAKKRGVAPTTQKRNEYDKVMADTLKNRLSRWIKGVSVKWVNFIAPEEGGDVRAAKIGTAQVTRPYLKKIIKRLMGLYSIPVMPEAPALTKSPWLPPIRRLNKFQIVYKTQARNSRGWWVRFWVCWMA